MMERLVTIVKKIHISCRPSCIGNVISGPLVKGQENNIRMKVLLPKRSLDFLIREKDS